MTVQLYQHLTWGSAKWRKAYDKRTYVESSFGSRKHPNTENMNRGQHQVCGLARVNLVHALSAVSANIRMLRKWHAGQPDRDVPAAFITQRPATELVAVPADLDTRRQQHPGKRRKAA